MNPLVVFIGLLFFFGCMVLHIIIWRMRTPWVSSAVLIMLFFAVPAVLVAVAVSAGVAVPGLDGEGLAAALFLHCSLAFAYIASYPAVRAVSPSLDILLMIVGSGCMTENELKEGFAERRLVGARIDDLKAYRLVRETPAGYRLTPLATLIALVFAVYRRLLGMPLGGG